MRPSLVAAAIALATVAPGRAQEEPLGRTAAFGVLEVEPMARVPAGAPLRSRPDPRAEALAVFETDLEVPILERRGRWIRTHHADATGWVAPGGEPTLEEYRQEAVASGYLVVDTTPAERAERIRSARRFLSEENRDFRELAGWPLHTDVDDAGELARLDRVARQLRKVYEERFGLRPSDEPSRAVVLYRDESAYRRFVRDFTNISDLHGDGHADDAMAALYLSATKEVDSAAVLVHELTHLVNRDVFLRPPATWIEEGLANDLGLSRIDDRGDLTPGTLGVRNTRSTTSGGQFVWSRLLGDWRENRRRLQPVTDVLDLSWTEFVNDRDRQSNYAQSTFFVRYLLDACPPAVGAGFRDFLASVSRGGPAGSAALAEALGSTVAQLRTGYERWLTQRAEAAR